MVFNSMPNVGCGIWIECGCIILYRRNSSSFTHSVSLKFSFCVAVAVAVWRFSIYLFPFFYLVFVFHGYKFVPFNVFFSPPEQITNALSWNDAFHKIFALQPIQNAFLGYSNFKDEYNKISFYLIICLPWAESMQQTLE